jgi:hypothetical protein
VTQNIDSTPQDQQLHPESAHAKKKTKSDEMPCEMKETMKLRVGVVVREVQKISKYRLKNLPVLANVYIGNEPKF